QRTSLLIVCTTRIFTALTGEYRWILRVSSIQPNAHLTIADEGGSVSYLRTVLAFTSITSTGPSCPSSRHEDRTISYRNEAGGRRSVASRELSVWPLRILQLCRSLSC